MSKVKVINRKRTVTEVLGIQLPLDEVFRKIDDSFNDEIYTTFHNFDMDGAIEEISVKQVLKAFVPCVEDTPAYKVSFFVGGEEIPPSKIQVKIIAELNTAR